MKPALATASARRSSSHFIVLRRHCFTERAIARFHFASELSRPNEDRVSGLFPERFYVYRRYH